MAAVIEPWGRRIINLELSDKIPDTKIQVLSSVIHVHSEVLKKHSAFFRKFMDSADKTPPKVGANWRYEYVSVRDEDLIWALEAKQKTDEQFSTTGDAHLDNEQIEAFVIILYAMHGKKYFVNSFDLLKLVTKLADFYRALPILSSSLCAALKHKNSKIKYDIASMIGDRSKTTDLLKVAYQLRQPSLLRDCIIIILARETRAVTPPVYELALKKFHELQAKIGLNSYALLSLRRSILAQLPPNVQDIDEDQLKIARAKIIRHTDRCLVDILEDGAYAVLEHKKLVQAIRRDDLGNYTNAVRKIIQPLLKNNLNFAKVKAREALMCTEISDAELPWDTSETEW